MDEKKDAPLVVNSGNTLVIESTISWGNDAKVICMEVIPAATAVKDNASYDIGYKDGESSVRADWLMMIDEHFDVDGDAKPVLGPYDFLTKLRTGKIRLIRDE